jgi:hypothetical protein
MDHADGEGGLQPALATHAHGGVDERLKVEVDDVVGESLGHGEDAAVELGSLDGVDAVGGREQRADLALEQRLPGRTAAVAAAIEARRDAAHAAYRLLEQRHVAADAPETLADELQRALARHRFVEAQDLAQPPEGGGVNAVREQARVAVGADRLALAARDGGEKALHGAVPGSDRVRAGHEEAAVIVGPAGEGLAPGGLTVRLDSLALGHVGDLLGRQGRDDLAQQAVAAADAGAVAAFQDVEQQ